MRREREGGQTREQKYGLLVISLPLDTRLTKLLR